MLKGQCRCGAVHYRLKPPVAYTGHCLRGQESPRVTLLTVPKQRFVLKSGSELLEDCASWQLCNRCGTTLFFPAEEMISALPATIDWPAQNVHDLHEQSGFGNHLNVRKLIQRGMSLEPRFEGWTPLMHAIGSRSLNTCRVLLEHGAQVETALGNAARSNSLETPALLRLLLRYGADRHKLFGETVWGGRVRDARAIYSSEIDLALHHKDRPLLHLASFNSAGMIRFLPTLGAKVGQLTEDGRDPLRGAAYRGRRRRLEALLEGAPSPEVLEDALVAACDGGQSSRFLGVGQSAARARRRPWPEGLRWNDRA